jgi:hypothetical protein
MIQQKQKMLSVLIGNVKQAILQLARQMKYGMNQQLQLSSNWTDDVSGNSVFLKN